MFKLVVLFSVVALAAAKPSLLAPLAYTSTLVPGSSSLSEYSTSVVHGAPLAHGYYGAHALPAAYGYAPTFAALSQAPHSPALVLDAVHGVPLDTPEVVAARAAHFQAKALSGLHHLKKRSLPLAYSSSYLAPHYGAPLAYSSSYLSPYATPYASSLLTPYGLAPKALSIHPW